MDNYEVEIRSAQVADVSFPKGEIEMIVMPYESPTRVEYHGRMIEEVVSRGAFDGIDKPAVAHRVKVNLDHKHGVLDQIADTTALHPSREEGLVAEVKIRRKNPYAEYVMDCAEKDKLGASAGFALLFDKNGKTYPDAEIWERSRTRRRLQRLWLDHIALTPEPAYAAAKMLAIRSAQQIATTTATPNRDRLEIELLREAYADIDARYAVNQH